MSAVKVNSTVKINPAKVKQLTSESARALELTAEALRTEIVQAQVMPRMDGGLQGEQSHISAGESITYQYKDRNGENTGEVAINTITKENDGKVSIITTAPQARRLYFHPEYNFHQEPWEEEYFEWEDESGKKHRVNFDGNEENRAKWKKEMKERKAKAHRVKHDGNPNAKGKWFEDWMKGGKHEDFVQKTFKKFLKQLRG